MLRVEAGPGPSQLQSVKEECVMGIRSKIGETVVELHQLRRREAELKVIARQVPILERQVSTLERRLKDSEAECLQLRRQVYGSGKFRRRAHEPKNVA
jgi:hypothetical protein